ncbi:BRCT domain-containing protein [Piromyces finnis]|uniref:BRCT domain-containing protein n=1 Tax=Piromyces finnis TaxID=1754191 RepID=A0A1Y1V6K5_9FUNG|nr:BRCT domain-containing protein [Piromyces finnis]|eukprot:ORX48402.1 BRCT domain-containing protein [Piromyces finnis]
MSFYKDIVICCSSLSLEEKEKQYNAIKLLGGSYKKNLTRKVTHLITDSTESEKYEISIQIGIPVLTPQWIYHCLQNRDSNLNPYEEMKNFLYKPFNDYVINIPDTTYDKDNCSYLIKIIEYLGGVFEEQVNSDCTHVVTNNPYNSTYDILRRVNVKVYTPDWVYENYLKYVFYIEKINYKENLKIKSEIENFNFFRKKIFYLSDSFSEETKKMLLKIILKGKGNCSKELTNDVTTFITKEQILDKNDKKLLLQSSCGTCIFINYSWLLKCYFDKCYIPESFYEIPNSFQNSSSVNGSLFKGLTFFIYNFESVKENSLKELIMLQQGTIYNKKSPIEVNGELLIVTSFTREFDSSFINEFPMKTKLITNYWVEKCILKKKLYDFDKCPLFIPCNLRTKINGFEFLKITITGFNKFEKLYIKKLILKMGSTYTTELSQNNTFLICHDDNAVSEKCIKASEWNVPIILVQWLYDCYNNKNFLCYDNYQVKF